MPRNITTGIYTRPSNTFSNPVDGQVIEATDATSLFNDQDTAFTDSLSRSGSGGMLADFKLGPFAANASAITTPASPSSGAIKIYAKTVSGVQKLAFLDSTGLETILGQAPTYPITTTQGGTNQTAYTNGQLLIGNTTTTGLDKATLTAGSNISITNGPGSITIASTAGGGTTNYFNVTKVDQTPAGGTYGTLSGTVNGTNAVFTVSNNAYASGSLRVFLNGQELYQGASYDWVETTPGSGTFTFNTAPATGSLIQAVYITQATTAGIAPAPLTTLTGINGKTMANTLAYTSPIGKTTILTSVPVRVTASTAITNGPTISIGTTAGASDIFAAIPSTNTLTSVNALYSFIPAGISLAIPPSGTVYFNLTAAATGTSQTLEAYFMGFQV